MPLRTISDTLKPIAPLTRAVIERAYHGRFLLLRWFRDTLCEGEVERAREADEDTYDRILADVPEGPTELLVLPHFIGSGTPWLDTRSEGAMAKAILEGLSFELRVNLELL